MSTQALHILSGGAAQGLARSCAPAFEAQHHAQIVGTFGAVGAMKTRLLEGQACDVVILTQALIEELVAQHQVRAGSAAALGAVKTAVAVKAGTPHPQVDHVEGLKAALLAASGIYFPDPQLATAGIHFMKVLQGLGVAEQLQPRLRPYPNGATAMKAMADCDDPHVIGCTQITEILITPGIEWVGNLPKAFELATIYTAGVTTRSTQPELAQAWIHALTDPGQEQLRRNAGFLPA